MSNKRIYIASDHRGVALKKLFVNWLSEQGYEPQDLGPSTEESVHASDYAQKVTSSMRDDPDARGVLICGSGQAMCMTANRFAHARAALCTNTSVARLCREHNDANILVLGAEVVGPGLALECLETFLTTDALTGRYADRCQLLKDLGGL